MLDFWKRSILRRIFSWPIYSWPIYSCLKQISENEANLISVIRTPLTTLSPCTSIKRFRFTKPQTVFCGVGNFQNVGTVELRPGRTRVNLHNNATLYFYAFEVFYCWSSIVLCRLDFFSAHAMG